jgi:hypothetical protein
MNCNLFLALSLLALCSSMATAQHFQTELVPAEAFEKYEQTTDLPPEGAVGTRFEVTRTEVQSPALPAPYDLDQWVTGEVASMLEDPANLRMIVDEKRANYACRGWGSAGAEVLSSMDTLLASKPYSLQEDPAPRDHNDSKGNRYENNPAPDFVIIDLAEGEHLGMVPGSWRP